MSKISTYEVVPTPKLADKLIGTSVGGEIEDVTYNFTLQELLELFIPLMPANNLQGILDFGNTATQDINLFGTITTTYLDVTDTANFLNSYFVGETHIQGGIFDSTESIGTAGQVLTSTGEFVEWVTLPPIFTPNLQQVLEEGNTADIDIVLDANIQALDINSETANIATQLTIQGVVADYNESVGTSGQVLSSTSTNVEWVSLPVYSATSPLLFNSATGVFSIQVANGSQNGYLSSSDWIAFNGKQNAGNYITALTGEATATGPGVVPITLSNAAVIGKVLTGFNPIAGTINPSDSILTAFGKTQSQINALVGGVQYQGVWNASTNVPTLTSSVGIQGHYYVVNVAGTTNLNGITDWQVGDWAIFSESVWQKVDNTDSVTSVNGFTGAVSLTTDNIPEGTTNLYFLNSRARLALSATSPLLYNNTTGVFSIQQASGSQNGFLSSTDWTTFNSKQDYLNGTGLVKSTAGTISYITDNSANWNTAYNDSITSAAVTGTGTKTLTLTQQDAGTITASWTDLGLTSVGVSMPSAFNVANSPLTANGTIAITGAGNATQYVRGDGALATLPTNGGGGGASVSYYLNGSVNQGTIGGVTYYEMNRTPIIGAGTDFSRNSNGYIASFLTDANDPALLNIPAGNWNFETYFNASSGGGSPTFYIELYKYDGVVFTLIASNSGSPKLINDGTNIEAYFSALAVPQTTLTLTDRLAVRIYVTTAGRTITLHTENSHLCQVITTFTTGLTALNGLTAQVQYFATGTSGTDFNILSVTDTHTFNLPTASATNTGKLSSTDWSVFNAKQNALTLTTIGTSGAATLVGATLNIPQYTDQFVGTVTSVAALTLGTSGTDLSSTVADSTTTPVITLNVPTASASNRGALSSTDWSTFNAKVGSVTATSPLSSSGGSTPNITIQTASGSQSGALSSTDWTTFNNKQAAGNYITSLTGEATATGPGAAAVTLNNASVTAKVLTGINITGGTVQATDTMLTAFGKLQNQINGLIGSTIYQGTWNASTNTPALASGVGVRGYYYIVSVAGNTNLDGITDWFVGDWAIFDGTAWQQVDNTDAVVSVNGQTGAVSLTTDNIPEGATNQYFLNSRARAALSFTAGSGAYNSTTGVITIPTNTNQLTNGANYITLASLSGVAPIQYNSSTGAISITQAGTSSNGFLSSTDWNTFNNKQNALTNPITGISASGRVAYFNGDTSITGSSNFFWDATNNRLGIGLNNPQRTLEIHNPTADSQLRISGSAPSVSLGEAITGSIYQAKFGLATANGQYAAGAVAGDFVIISQTGATIFSTSSTEKMRVQVSGNVSIGNTNDTYKLDVTGTGRFTSNLYTSTALYIGTTAAYGFKINSEGNNGFYNRGGSTTGHYPFLLENSSGALLFQVQGTGAATFSSSVAVGTGMTIGTSGTNDIVWNTAGGIKLSRTNVGPEYALSQRWTGSLAFVDIASSSQWNGGVCILPNGGGNVGIGTTSPTVGKLVVLSSDTTISMFGQNIDSSTTIGNSFVGRFRNGFDGNGLYSLVSFQVQNASGVDQVAFIGAQSVSGASNYQPNTVFGVRNGASTYTEYMRITSGGVLKIGNGGTADDGSNPGYKNVAISFNNAQNRGEIQAVQQGLLVYPLILNGAGGNVGIGTYNPTKRLDIYDANTLGTDDIVRAYQNLGYNHAFYRSQRNGGANMLIGATRDNVDGNLSANISVLWNVSNNDMAFGTNNTERMRITSGGNVLIGITERLGNNTNTNPLQVYGGVTIAAQAGVFTYATLQYSGVDFLITGNAHPANLGLNSIVFRTGTSGGGAPQEWMRITSTGVIDFNGNSGITSVNDKFAMGIDGTSYAWIQSYGGRPIVLNAVGNNVGIGLTNPNSRLEVSLPSGVNGQIIRMNRSAGAYGWGIGIDVSNSNFNFYNNSNTSVANINNSTGAYTATSDQRLKLNILDSENALNKVLQIKVRKYDWKDTNIKEDYGFVAQELFDILPQYVHKGNENTNWGVAKAELVPILVKAIQEQQTQINELKSQLNK
jgi:hypothetical protein